MDPGAEAYHKAHPDKPVIGTETVSAVGTRGIYITDSEKGYVGSYDPYTTTGRASAEGWWSFCDARPGWPAALCGPASTIAASPRRTAGRTSARSTASSIPADFPRTPSTTTNRGGPRSPSCICFRTGTGRAWKARRSPSGCIRTSTRSSCSSNGQSLGAKEMKKDSHLAWNVNYAPGAIEARGYKDGKLVMTAKRETTGAPAELAIDAGPQRRSPPMAKTWPCSPWKCAMRRAASCPSPTTKSHSGSPAQEN